MDSDYNKNFQNLPKYISSAHAKTPTCLKAV